jgi:O-antigen/teichoic acid export membrane protein
VQRTASVLPAITEAWHSPRVRRIANSGFAHGVPPLATFATTPLLLRRLGLDRYGFWSVVMTALMIATTLDGGASASVVRFTGIHRTTDDRRATSRVTVSALIVVLAVGLVIGGLALAFGPLLSRLVSSPQLQGDALFTIRWFPILAVLYMAGAILVSVLQAHGRFGATAVTSLVSSAGYVAGVIILTERHGLRGLVMAMLIELTLILVLAGVFAAPLVDWSRPRPLAATELRALAPFATRIQVATFLSIANGQLDVWVVALLLPLRDVAIFSVGLQVATAARLLPLWCLPPLYAGLVDRFARRGQGGVESALEQLEPAWHRIVTGYTLVSIPAGALAVVIWLGGGFTRGAVVAGILILGSGFNLGSTAVLAVAARTLGYTSAEARFYGIMTAVNVALTIPLGLLWGMYGVVAATTCGSVVGSLYFLRAIDRRGLFRRPRIRLSGIWSSLLAATAVGGCGELIVHFGGRGTAWLGVFGVATAGVAVLLGAVFATGLRPAFGLDTGGDGSSGVANVTS